jgi:hypothetical protein
MEGHTYLETCGLRVWISLTQEFNVTLDADKFCILYSANFKLYTGQSVVENVTSDAATYWVVGKVGDLRSTCEMLGEKPVVKCDFW